MSGELTEILSEGIQVDDHIAGPPDAPLTLVEYADFECLHCGRAYPALSEIREAMAGTLRFVFRHFPLGWEHPHAHDAALAAEAAARQGKFWDMHARLFEQQDRLYADALRAHARTIGLDLAQYALDIADSAVEARVRRDIDSGRESAVRGTPAFFVNGVRHHAAWDLEGLRDALRAAANAAPRALPR
jgi:protein-disulfide isomerase